MGKSFILNRLTPVLPGLLFVASAIPAFAGQQDYTVTQALDNALRHNGELNVFREEKGIFEAARTRSGLYPNPAIEIDGSTGALTGSRSESSISLGFSQEFLTAGKRAKRSLIAEQELGAYQLWLADRERLLTEELRTTFYDVLLADKRQELAEQLIRLNRDLLNVARERLAAGDIPELEANLVRVELSRSESKKIDLQRETILARSRLSTLMGLASSETVKINGSFAPPPKPGALPELVQKALAQRPDLRAMELERTKGDSGIALAQAESVPNLTAGLSAIRETTAADAGRTEKYYLIGLKLTIPIPVFDRNKAGIQEARSRKSSAETRYHTIRKNIEREVETAFARLNSAETIVTIYGSDILAQLEENLKLIQEAYRLGEVGILAVFEEQKKYFEINDGYLSALHGRQVAFTKLESAVATDITGGAQ